MVNSPRSRRSELKSKKRVPTPSAAPISPGRRWLLIVLLCAVTVVIYAPVRQFEFLNYDDYAYVVENPHVASGLSAANLRWAFTAFEAGNWHPLTWLSHMIDCQVFGPEPAGHHLTNLAIHMLNTVLVFVVLLTMTSQLWWSYFVALLFALHPLNVESVAWIAERKNVLSTLFWLLAIWAYARFAARRDWKAYLLVAVFLSLGLLSKPMVVTLPFVLLLLDYWPLGRVSVRDPGWLRKAGKLALEKVPLLALSAASSSLTVLAQKAGGAVTTLEEIPLDVRVLNAIVSYLGYLVKMIWPSPLAVFYPHPGSSLSLGQVSLTLLILLAISVLAFRTARSKPYFLVGWFWYLGTLVPVIGLVQVGNQAMADRYAYLSLVGPFLMIVWGLGELAAHLAKKKTLNRPGRWLAGAGACALVALALTTRVQLVHWRNSLALFEHTRDVTENNYVAYTNIGIVFNKQQRWDEAIESFSQAVRIRPQHASAHSELGVALAKTGKTREAIEHFGRAIDIYPTAVTYTNLGLAHLREGRPDQSVEKFRSALRLNPGYFDAHLNLAIALSRLGKLQEARGHFLEAIRIDPSHAGVRSGLGTLLAQQGSWTEAIEHLSAAVERNPDNADARNNLGAALLQKGDVASAVRELRRAVEINPNHADAHSNLGVALLQQNDVAGATRHFQTALKLNPNHENARKYLKK
jgi:Tfp pilus assembly protein PilF